MASPPFHFKSFSIEQTGAVHPVGTDSVLIGAWAPVTAEPATVLDIGCGTGVVALMLAQRTRFARIEGVEIHLETAECAARNFKMSPWPERLHLYQTSFQAYAEQCRQRYDLIVSNPPFFSDTVVAPDPNRRLARYAGTLKPGELIEGVLKLMNPEGVFATILPPEEGKRLQEMGTLNKLYCTRVTEVYTLPGKPVERLLLVFQRNPRPFKKEKLVLFDRHNVPSAGYRLLTDAFYKFM